MKSLAIKVAMLTAAIALAQTVSAQSVKSVLSDVVSKVTQNSSALSSAADVLIGTSKVTAKDIAGTWKYSQPAVAFESEGAVTKVGGAVAASKLEEKMSTYLAKVGISKGKFTIVFNADGTFTSTVNGKSVKGKYSINGSTITFTKSNNSKIKINANVKKGTTLQITFKADKLLQFAQQFGSVAGKYSSTLSTVTQLAKNYNGMQLGMRFTK